MSNAVVIEISFITDKITLYILSLRGDLKIHAIQPAIFLLISLYKASLKSLSCLHDRSTPSPKEPIPS